MMPPIQIDDEDDLEKLGDNIKNAFKAVQGSSAFSWDRDRPYNGQPWTDNGERGKTFVEGLTMRDIADCFVAALFDSCVSDELRKLKDTPLHDFMYRVDLSEIDPGAWQQNLTCRIEMMMGIHPNIPKSD